MGNVIVLGPRSSGKTTYLAALAHWPKRLEATESSNNIEIFPISEEAQELQKKAENIIASGESMRGTDIPKEGVSDLPVYSFQLKIKQRNINLVVRDFAGEIFEALTAGQLSSLHDEFFQECMMEDISGCLIMLSEWSLADDKSYSSSLSNFIELMDKYDRMHNFRLAIALSKCERGELWPGRLDPELDLFNVHLRRTRATLLQAGIPKNNLYFSAVSTFGVLNGNDPRPNRVQIPDSFEGAGQKTRSNALREPDIWRPHGLFAPIYWLSTGKRMKQSA